MDKTPRRLLESWFHQALAAVTAEGRLPACLPPPPPGHTVVVGAGKAAAAMARAVEKEWPDAAPLGGVVATRYGHGLTCRRIEVLEAAHPVPDLASAAAARRMLTAVAGLSRDDLVLALISGGGSALLALPAPGVTLADKRRITDALLRSGAPIAEINCVRKHLSAIKGGRLAAAAHPARVLTLAISDVPGDHPATIASGPTVADPTTVAEARAILDRHRIAPPPGFDESPKPGDPRLAGCETRIVAMARDALEAAAAAVRRDGFSPLILGDDLQGEARVLAASQSRLAMMAAPGTVLLSGGETAVTVTGNGRGGRNAEYLLALALALDGHPRIHALACDTDGIDGSEDNAGAVIGPDTLRRGPDALARLADNDAHGYFAALGDLVVTGPTLTNVNDFRAILVL
ncbi:MAG: glycerate kinase [Magnetospirillum sp. WYHS-4]